MHCLMPGWVYPEAKIPVKFSLDEKCVSYEKYCKPIESDELIIKRDNNFRKAVENNDLRLIKFFLKETVRNSLDSLICHAINLNNYDYSENNYLYPSCKRGHIKILKFLIKKGADVKRIAIQLKYRSAEQ